MDQYDEYNDPDQLQGIFDNHEDEWDSEYEDALTDRMHRQAEYEAKINNPPYIPSSPISSLAKRYKDGELILSDFNQKKLEMEKIKKSKELNAKLFSIIKNFIINFILVFIIIALCDLGRRLLYMLVDINYFRHLTYTDCDLARMLFYSIFEIFLNTLHLQFWYYFIIIIQQFQFFHFYYCFIRALLRMSNWLTRIKIKER